MAINTQPQNIEVPKEAMYVLYRFPGTSEKNTLQKTLLMDESDVLAQYKVSKTWKDIRKGPGFSYGVSFKDRNHKLLPYTYIIIGDTVSDLNDLLSLEYDIESDLEQAEASNVLAHTGLNTYIKTKLLDILVYIPFDPATMILVAQEEKK
ncbi:MAG: hypothetical protein NTY80_01395 [candidate division SR1 bacterium]|nr:hypothetical protein [candidate division SR1 bacterium]